MKTIFYSFTAIALLTVTLFSCKKETVATETDDEITFQMADQSTIESNGGFKSAASSNICCFTPTTNITRDPEFLGIVPSNLYGVAPCNNLKKNTMTGYNTDWFATPYGSNSPQVGVINCSSLGLSMGACNRGYIHFWGNRQFGEAITQDNLAFAPTTLYTVQFNARIRPTNVGNARLAVRLSTAIPNSKPRTGSTFYSPQSFVSPIIQDTTWRCYKFQFKDSTSYYKVLNLFPVNQFSGTSNFSRLDIDDVKIW